MRREAAPGPAGQADGGAGPSSERRRPAERTGGARVLSSRGPAAEEPERGALQKAAGLRSCSAWRRRRPHLFEYAILFPGAGGARERFAAAYLCVPALAGLSAERGALRKAAGLRSGCAWRRAPRGEACGAASLSTRSPPPQAAGRTLQPGRAHQKRGRLSPPRARPPTRSVRPARVLHARVQNFVASAEFPRVLHRRAPPLSTFPPLFPPLFCKTRRGFSEGRIPRRRISRHNIIKEILIKDSKQG